MIFSQAPPFSRACPFFSRTRSSTGGDRPAVDVDMDEGSVAREAVDRVVSHTVGRTADGGRPTVEDALREAIHHERARLASATGARSVADRRFFGRLSRELGQERPQLREALLRELVQHYVGEIQGHFDPRTYAVATRLVPVAMSALLSGLSPANFVRSLGDLPRLQRNIVVEGEVAALQTLAGSGTVMLVPTHSSNFDSLILGLVLFQMGLPPFSYGAGLNLFRNPLTGFFMNRLGAYKVDRQKTDPLYRDTLKEFATVLLERGRHTLFFPGGTRSRSGAVETHLKKGLLGTGIVAFKNNVRRRKEHPHVFVFPATINYPLVLEARSLVADYLRQLGAGQYPPSGDEFARLWRWLEFLGSLLRLDLRVHVVIGKPLDPFGNEVDDADPAYPWRARERQSSVVDDSQQNAECTRELERRLLAAYHADNVALQTSIVAFALFELLRRRSPGLDLRRLLLHVRSCGPLSAPDVVDEVAAVLGELRAQAARGRIRMGNEVAGADAVVDRALRTFGTYHPVPVLKRRRDTLVVADADLLFFYRNRLEGYGLRGAAPLLPGIAH